MSKEVPVMKTVDKSRFAEFAERTDPSAPGAVYPDKPEKPVPANMTYYEVV